MAVRRKKESKGFSLANLKHLYDQGTLVLDPSYQREAVWTTSQKRLLVDSIVHDFDIPKLYFRELNDKEYQYEVVDGQQRLLAIYDFLEDNIRLPKDSDPYDEEVISEQSFSHLSTGLQLLIRDRQLDVTILSHYTDEEIEELFLRLQNGTPLNAPEKRRAIAGNVREVVKAMATHKVFDRAGFKNSRYSFEDAAAKCLRLFKEDAIVDIKAGSLTKLYENNPGMKTTDTSVKNVKTGLNLLELALKNQTDLPLKKHHFVTLPFALHTLASEFDIKSAIDDIGKAVVEFENDRAKNNQITDDNAKDPILTAYSEAARNDSLEALRFRHEEMRRAILRANPNLSRLDNERAFSEDQKVIIYQRDAGMCQSCGVECDLHSWHADHIQPYSKGGPTSVENGQVLCQSCNLKKSNKS